MKDCLCTTLWLFLFLKITNIHTQKRRRKKEKVWLWSFTLWQKEERDTLQRLFPASHLQCLPMKRETFHFDSIVDRANDYPDS